MWGNNKIKSSKIDTLICHGIEVEGNIRFNGGLHLDGKVIGNVSADDQTSTSVLVLSESGSIEGDVSVSFAVINGEVKGNVYASQKLELSPKARIWGDVHYNLLEMTSGAEVNGKMMHEAEKKLLEHQAEVDPKVTEIKPAVAQ